MAAFEGVHQRVFVDQSAAGHIDEDRAAFHLRDGGGIDHAAGLGSERRAEKEDVGLRENFRKCLGSSEPFDRGRLADREVVGGENPDAEGREHLHQPPAYTPQSHDADRRVGEVAGGAPDKLLPLLLLQEERKPPGAGDRQSEAMLGDLVGEHSGGARDNDVGADHRRHQAVVEPSR